MPHYHSLGKIPRKRHIQFRSAEGQLYREQLISTEGFSDIYSLTYHLHAPTEVTRIDKEFDFSPEIAIDNNMQHRSFFGANIKPEDDYLVSRKYLLVNNDIYIALSAPRQSMKNYFFRNASAHEMLFVHKGSGWLKSVFGSLKFGYGDYIIIPKGTIYQIDFETNDNLLLIAESFMPIRFPKRYMNEEGQLLEHSPFCERDIRKPENLQTFDEKGDFLVMLKKEDKVFPYHFQYHPFDVVGWDGCQYPYIISIHDFEPITGRIHQPPPVHQMFESNAYVICSFVPRLYDYHPLSVPAPYFHTNVDSDEVLYYVDGDFMSRNNIQKGQITLHPIGIPHGPHPGAIERSIGAEKTEELAVMIDTFRPLKITRQALEIEDKNYFKSWLSN